LKPRWERKLTYWRLLKRQVGPEEVGPRAWRELLAFSKLLLSSHLHISCLLTTTTPAFLTDLLLYYKYGRVHLGKLSCTTPAPD
jgi:hypothetical protein